MVFFQSFICIRSKCYVRCVQLLKPVSTKKNMSKTEVERLCYNSFFCLTRSRSWESFLMVPSSQQFFPPGSSSYFEQQVSQHENWNFAHFWQNYAVTEVPHPLAPPPPPPPLPQTSNFVSVQVNQHRKYSWKRYSAGNLKKINPEEAQEVLNLLKTRVWETVEEPKKDKPKEGFTFTVMSYNVLAQDLLTQHPYLYRKHNPAALRWEARWKNLYQEIKCLKPDILCLQEVQQSHLSTYITALKQLGYKGVYKKRTRATIDGCAIFYNDQILHLEEHETVEFFQPDVMVLNRDNVAIIAKFVPKLYSKKPFVVATTHLLYNPKRQDVRVAQTQLLLAEIERISFKNTTKKKSPYFPIIITGDFNSEPNSAVYNLITKGTLKYEHLTSRSLVDGEGMNPQGKCLVPMKLAVTDSCQHAKLVEKRDPKKKMTKSEQIALTELQRGDRDVQEVTTEDAKIDKPEEVFSTGTLSHKFALKSVYNHGQPSNCEATTYQNRWLTVDYIFYSGKKHDDEVKEHKLKLVSRYKLPLGTDCGRVKIPNVLLGSDHLSLMSKFRLKVD